jgi:uncharacterized membrane protein YphA (DoxX/SURF4 family)
MNPSSSSSILSEVFKWVCQLVACYMLVQAGLGKLSGSVIDISVFTTLGMEPFGRILIGILEIIAGLGLLHPLSAALSAFLGTGILTGALLAHTTHLGWEGSTFFFITYSTLLLAVWMRRHELPFSGERFASASIKS